MSVRSLLLRVALAGIVALSAAGCASKGSHSLACDSTGVSPSSQDGAATGRKALDAFLKSSAKSSGVPSSGYKLSHGTSSRQMYVSGKISIAVGTIGRVKDGTPAIWVVQQVFTCP